MTDNWSRAERLYNRLPAIYRIRDHEQGEPLRALLAVIEREMEAIEADIEGLYDDWFIETADEWLVPYLGDLLGVRPLHTNEDGVYSLRAYVANTLRYRRGKGKATILEQLALDVTGWKARAVEYFLRLTVNQHLDRVRYTPTATVDLRDANRLELIDSPFDQQSHTGEVRRIEPRRGKYNIPNVGLFLWRLGAYPVFDATARPTSDADGRYHFNPMGFAVPLFNNADTETDIATLAQENNVPAYLRRRALSDELRGRSAAGVYFGVNPVIEVWLNDNAAPLTEDELIVCNLNWDDPDWLRPTAIGAQTVAIDPQLGRLCTLDGVDVPEQLRVSYSYGFSADVGGGAYPRQTALDTLMDRPVDWSARVMTGTPAAPDEFNTLADAVDAWHTRPAGTVGVIAIDNSRTYAESLTAAQALQIPAGSRLMIIAAEPPASMGQPFASGLLCPHIAGDIDVTGTAGDADAVAGELILHGLWIEGRVRVLAGDLGQLTVSHTTLVPGRRRAATVTEADPAQLRWKQSIQYQALEPHTPSISVDASNSNLTVTLDRAITGALSLPDTLEHLTAYQSIIDSTTRPANTARHVSALLSGSLSTFPTLTSTTPTLRVAMGTDLLPVTLSDVPTTLPQARDALQAALDVTFGAGVALVTIVGTRLALLSTSPEHRVYVAPFDSDPTLTELRLDRDHSLHTIALLGEPRPDFAGLSTASPAVTGIYGVTQVTATLTGAPASLAQTRDALQTALRDADAAFADTFVVTIGDRLAVIATDSSADLALGTTPDDTVTLYEMGLDSHRAAISASANGHACGPPATLQEVTLFGAVRLRELYASEVIFNDAVQCQRTQVGCVRFSYVPRYSRVPRRYRCQPDLALNAADPTVNPEDIRARIHPHYTSTDYGHPAYAQLTERCAVEIRTGAEDESEMGVFSHLKQPQRIANLRAALDEYLRVGLETGIFYVT